MATTEFIQKRIAGKEKELEKLNKKLERIRKVEAQGWQDPNPYYYHESDLKYTLRDIEEAQKALENYKSQLVVEQEKASSRNVPVIVEFLNNWRDRVTDFHREKFKEYYNEKHPDPHMQDADLPQTDDTPGFEHGFFRFEKRMATQR